MYDRNTLLLAGITMLAITASMPNAMLPTNGAGYSTAVPPELVVDALAWGDGLMETCWNDNHMHITRHTMLH